MTIDRARRRLGCLLAAVVLASPAPLAAQSAVAPVKPPAAATNLAAAVAQYRRDLADYTKAHDSYVAAASAYWHAIAEKRQARNAKRAAREQIALDDYVLDQPPVYTGPPKPVDPLKPNEPAPPPPYVPVVADFLAAAREDYKFTPRLPRSESDYKRAYAAVAAVAGLTAEQAVRVYGFEASGNGSYDVQAGLEFNKNARAISTALGYNQLLATNSVEIVAEDGNNFIKTLAATAAQLPDDREKALETKIATLRKMIEFAKSVPDDWGEHEALAGTRKGLAIHALNLDLDIGPLLQTQKLLDSVIFARRKGFAGTLSAAELEMMNLTGDGNGFDMVTMPPQWRDKVPTANFFQPHGYQDNPVARRNNVVAKLIAATDAAMDSETKKPGAGELAADFR
jgi:hypothetical protein